ncbi:MAG: DUF4469 domain-containing protein [Tannerellaceae bacterium]|jgi:hypothetical protein|nr:DUF4469 domain-containing protein [Tannerellaceae bacterium]
MALDFILRDVIHRITVKFFPASLPKAKKPYNLRAVYQPELDIHGIASKAEMYNITTSPKVIEEGMTAGMELIYYLAADGYKINTPVFRLKVGTPGEYDGYETYLPEGLYPYGQIILSSKMREYLKKTVKLQFDGIEYNEGFISSIFDKQSDTTDTYITPGGIFILNGTGLKITADNKHAEDTGLYYESVKDGSRIKENKNNIAQNNPGSITALCGQNLSHGEYHIVIRTQATVGSSNKFLKNVREVKSDFTVNI